MIAVPSPIRSDKTANLEHVRSATASIVPYLEKGNLVILESTVPPRTVEDVMIPELIKSGLEIGTDPLRLSFTGTGYPGAGLRRAHFQRPNHRWDYPRSRNNDIGFIPVIR